MPSRRHAPDSQRRQRAGVCRAAVVRLSQRDAHRFERAHRYIHGRAEQCRNKPVTRGHHGAGAVLHSVAEVSEKKQSADCPRAGAGAGAYHNSTAQGAHARKERRGLCARDTRAADFRPLHISPRLIPHKREMPEILRRENGAHHQIHVLDDQGL